MDYKKRASIELLHAVTSAVMLGGAIMDARKIVKGSFPLWLRTNCPCLPPGQVLPMTRAYRAWTSGHRVQAMRAVVSPEQIVSDE